MATAMHERSDPSNFLRISPDVRLGRGVAYSTTDSAHLLNVPAEAMSAWSGEPDHFAKQFEAQGGDRRDFAERRQFGHYLGEILDHAVASGRTATVDATATSAIRHNGGWHVELDDGRLKTRQERQVRTAWLALRGVLRSTKAEYILFLEDDLLFNRHLRYNLEHWQPLASTAPSLVSTFIEILTA